MCDDCTLRSCVDGRCISAQRVRTDPLSCVLPDWVRSTCNLDRLPGAILRRLARVRESLVALEGAPKGRRALRERIEQRLAQVKVRVRRLKSRGRLDSACASALLTALDLALTGIAGETRRGSPAGMLPLLARR